MKRLLLSLGTLGVFVLAVLVVRTEPAAPEAAAPLPAALGAIHPRLSPDGTSVAFSYQGEIWVGPRTGGTMRRLVPGRGQDVDPAWSPDGKRIAFVRGDTVQVVEVEGGKLVELRAPPRVTVGFGTRLEFSGDGRRLLGIFRNARNERELAWADLETGALQTVTGANYRARYAVAHDGKTAFTTGPDRLGEQSGSDGCHTDVWKVAAGGGTPEKVVRFPARIRDLAWAADGRALVVAAELGQAHEDLWHVPLADPLRGMRRLTNGQADENRPSLSRGGKWLCYSDNRAGATAVVIRDTATGAEQELGFTAMDFGKPTGRVKLRFLDKATGEPTVARVSLLDEAGQFRGPPGCLYRAHGGTLHFYGDRAAEFTVPAGRYRLVGRRGSEYRGFAKTVVVEPGRTVEAAVELERWTHMAARGWYSGETHIHANYGYGAWYCTPEAMRQQCVGEDLNVANLVVANSEADVVYDRPFFRGGPDPLSTRDYILYWNQEFRSTLWGHMTLLNLKQVVEPVFTGFPETTNPWDSPTNGDVADRTHWQKGLVNYTHVATAEDPLLGSYSAKAIPVDVALGKIDTLDINNGWQYSVPLWHRLLNCGFRVPATAGTDVFLNRVESNLPGHARVYVRLNGPLDYAAWIDGLKAGRSFVTTAPILEFTVNGVEPGGTVKTGPRPRVRVKATATSSAPLRKVEVLHNGTVLAAVATGPEGATATLDREFELPDGGWLALRADGERTADMPASLAIAHSNPVYVEADGKTFRSKQEAEKFLTWIDRLEVMARTRDRFPTPKHREQALEQLEAARNVYRQILREAP